MHEGEAIILVVDDDKRFAKFLSTLLESAGMRVLTAHAAEEALAEVRRQRPDAAIIDVMLPRLSGYALLRELRHEHGGRLPVIFVSGERTDPVDRTAGILLGGDDYLVKPLHPEELLARLERLLDRPRPSHGETLVVDLTNREVEVLQLVAEGMPPATIASTLSISRKTVSSHMQRIFAKLGVHTRAQAVAIAYEGGLIRVTPANGNGGNRRVDADVAAHLDAVVEA